ncbi:MAG TPA: hypothetical protein VF663_07715, partial [Telluria sp.]
MSTEIADPPTSPAQVEPGLASILHRDGAVCADFAAGAPALLADIDRLVQSGRYFLGLDYSVLMQLLYGPAPAPADAGGAVRFAAGVASFDMARRGLYRDPRIRDGEATYSFE